MDLSPSSPGGAAPPPPASDEDAYLAHVLSLLQSINRPLPPNEPSTSITPFSPATTPPALPPFTGPGRSPTSDAIHAHLQSLASRLHSQDTLLAEAHHQLQQSAAFAAGQQNGGHGLDTPEITPPIASSAGGSSSYPDRHQNLTSRLISTISSTHPLASSMSTPGAGGSILTAGEELVMLKSQVQDVARVCKVRAQPPLFASAHARP